MFAKSGEYRNSLDTNSQGLIGINHNREKGEGALNISFYDADSCEMAGKLLKEYNYKII